MSCAVKYSQTNDGSGFPEAYPAKILHLPEGSELPSGFVWSSLEEVEALRLQFLETEAELRAISFRERDLECLREKRDSLLKQSDWSQLPDAPLSEEDKMLWKNYRQSLRDLPETGDLSNLLWPQIPVGTSA